MVKGLAQHPMNGIYTSPYNGYTHGYHIKLGSLMTESIYFSIIVEDRIKTKEEGASLNGSRHKEVNYNR